MSDRFREPPNIDLLTREQLIAAIRMLVASLNRLTEAIEPAKAAVRRMDT